MPTILERIRRRTGTSRGGAKASATYNGVPLEDYPIELGPGRGDLRSMSTMFEGWGDNALTLINGRVVSYAALVETQPYVGAAVYRMLMWAARVPLKAYRRTGEQTRERLYPGQHPLADAIVEPWERGAQVQLISSLLGPQLVHGNGLSEVENGAMDKIRFRPLTYQRSKPIMPFEDSIAGWKYTADNQERTLPVDSVVHVSWWAPRGPLGLSPLSQLGTTVRLEQSAQEYAEAYMRQGARPPSGIKLPEDVKLTDEERAELRSDMAAMYAGAANAGRPALLPYGIDWVSIAHSAHEAELIEQRKLNREEVCAVYQIPPPMLGILDKATYSNIETQRQMTYTDCLGPPLILIEQLLNAQLVRGLLRETDVFLEFDFGPVLRGDRLKEIQALRQGVAGGIYTPNEARGVLNLPPSEHEDADSLWMPVNNAAPIGTNRTTKQGA